MKIIRKIIILFVLINAILTSILFMKNSYEWSKVKYHEIKNLIQYKSKCFYEDKSIVIDDNEIGSLFDPCIIYDEGLYKMYVSYRNDKSIVLYESKDGYNFEKKCICLRSSNETGWETNVNRACVIKSKKSYLMYYTGQENGISRIGLATSSDGMHFTRYSEECILKPEESWENYSVMNPFVIYDENEELYKMWYSAGETYEPNVICYATSMDGIKWDKYKYNPVFSGTDNWYDSDRVSVGHVLKTRNEYYMFYIGYKDIDTANICLVRSKNGISNWEVFDDTSLILQPSKKRNDFDKDACYKPSVVYCNEEQKYLLYYNGRNEGNERIGKITLNNIVIE